MFRGPFSCYSYSLSFLCLHSPGLFCPHSSPEESWLHSKVLEVALNMIFKFLLTGDHQEEHRMCSCYSDASYSKSPLGIRVTHFCLNSILPCTSSPARCKEEGKTNLTTWHFSLNISCNCSIRLCPLSSTGKSFF